MSSDWLLQSKITDETTVKTQIHMLTFHRMDSIDDECKNSNSNTYIRVTKQSPPELNFMYAGLKEWIYGYVLLWYLKTSCGLGILGIYYTFVMHVIFYKEFSKHWITIMYSIYIFIAYWVAMCASGIFLS